MAREFARIKLTINDDPDFEDLSMAAQWFYVRVLLPNGSLSSCGVADWRPKRLTQKAADAGIDVVMAAAAELEAQRFLLFDPDTEEVLVRSFVRSDELLRNPKMAGSILKSYQAIASRTLRAAVAAEIARARNENPEYSSWTHKDTAAGLSKIVSRADAWVVHYTNVYSVPITNTISNAAPVRISNPVPVPITDPAPMPITNRITNRISNPGPGPDNQPQSVDFLTATSTLNSATATEGGYVSGELTSASAGDNEPPPRNCPKHPAGTTAPCRACGDARRAADELADEQRRAAAAARSADARLAAADRARAIDDCGLCDGDGNIPGVGPCSHDPDRADRARRGMAAIRAVLAAKHPVAAEPAVAAVVAEGEP